MTHGTGQAIFGLGDETDSNSADALAGTQAELDAHGTDTSTHGVAVVAGMADIVTHASLTTGVHGAGASTVATVANISTHEGLTTGVHGVGGSTVATVGNIATHAALPLATAVHGLKGIKRLAVAGANETLNVNEVKEVVLTGGLATEHFKLTIGVTKTGFITFPTGGFANLLLADVNAAIQAGDWTGKAGVVATGPTGGPFLITFGGTVARTNIAGMSMTDNTGAAAMTINEDGVPNGVAGVAGTQYTVTGLATGDMLADTILWYEGDPAVGGGWTSEPTMASRASGDLVQDAVDGSKVDVWANNTNYSGDYWLLFEFLDLT